MNSGLSVKHFLIVLSFLPLHSIVSKEMDECKLDLMEESPPDTIVGNLIKDCGLSAIYNQNILSSFRYSFLHSDSVVVKFFELDEKSGELRRSKLRLDRDHPDICRRKDSCQLNLDVAIKPVQRAERVKVRAELLDMNDNSPSFRENEIFLSINEASPVGSSYLLPAASDDDSPTFGIQRYEIESPSEKLSMIFSMSVSGILEARLVLKMPLDREAESHYTLTLKAIDGGRGGLGGFSSLTGTMTISVIVTDFNDNKPVFTMPSYEVTLKEDIPVGSTIIGVSATDEDESENAEIEYAFTADTMKMCGSIFELNNRSGHILLIDSLDREKTSVHQLRVMAKDKGSEPMSSEAVVIVRVDDVNDNHPIITVTFLDEGRNSDTKPLNSPHQSKFVSTEISEDAEAGSFVGHVSVRDSDEGDGGKVECRINGSFKFTLQKSFFIGEYRIVLSSSLDRENSPFYIITLSCFDHGANSKTSEMLVKIVIKDVNDNAPEFEHSSYRASLAENNFIGEVVLQVSAKDQDEGDNSKIDYGLEGHVERYFQIDQRGLISALVRIDRELTDSFRFHVLAKDRGSPKRSSSAEVIITIDDLNDERPIFSKSLYAFKVLENEAMGTSVGKIEAKDKDLAPFNEFFYHISSENSASVSRLFHVHPKTGIITTKGIFDREVQYSYKFHVSAVDSHVELMSGTAIVQCSILDQNDNFPDIRFPTNNNDSIYISNRLAVGSVIGRVDAVDNDTNLNSKLSYRIVNGEKTWFQVDKDTGIVKTTNDLTKHDFQVIKINIEVSDHGDPPNSRFAELKIHINSSANSGHQRMSKSEFLSSISGAYTLVLVIAVTSIVFIFVIALLVCAVLLKQHKQRRSSKHKSGLSFISCDEAYELAQSTPNKDLSISSPQTKTSLSHASDPSVPEDHDTFFNGVGSRGSTSTKFGKKYQPLTVLHESSNVAEVCLHNGGTGGKQQALRYQFQSKGCEGRSSTINNSPLPPPPPPRVLHRFLAQRYQGKTSASDVCCGMSLISSNPSVQRQLNDTSSHQSNKRMAISNFDSLTQQQSGVSPSKRQARSSPQGSLESSFLSSETSSRQGKHGHITEKKVVFNLESPKHLPHQQLVPTLFKLESDDLTAKSYGDDNLKIKEVSV